MLRYVLAFLLGLHGFFHMIGFAKAANPAGMDGMTLFVSKSHGSLWILCAFLFIAAAGTYLSRKTGWWMVGLLALVLSQYLIMRFWADVKYATFVNAIILVAVGVGFGRWHFHRAASRAVTALHAGLDQASVVVNQGMLAPLPPVVARWLERAGVIGKPLTRTAWLRQSGEMRTATDGSWMAVSAEQWFTAEQPGFVWRAEIAAAPGVHIAGLDSLHQGAGRMLIKAMSLYPVADSTGPEIDQGAAVRFLAEILWMPAVALREYITWQQESETSAVATMAAGEQTVTARFTFDPGGDPVAVDADRYFTRADGATLEAWHVSVDSESYRSFEGVRVPARASVTWKLPDGDFEWFHVAIGRAVYNGTRP